MFREELHGELTQCNKSYPFYAAVTLKQNIS